MFLPPTVKKNFPYAWCINLPLIHPKCHRCTCSCGKSQQYAKVKVPPIIENPFGNIKVDVASLVMFCIYCWIYFTTEIKITLRNKLLTWVRVEAKKLFVTSPILMPNIYSIIIVVVIIIILRRCVIIHLLIIFTLAI